MYNIDAAKFKILVNKWKNLKDTEDTAKLNRLADETIRAINSEPLLKNICEIFMYSISCKALQDPGFHNIKKFSGNN